jgi:hypothetical protein
VANVEGVKINDPYKQIEAVESIGFEFGYKMMAFKINRRN